MGPERGRAGGSRTSAVCGDPATRLAGSISAAHRCSGVHTPFRSAAIDPRKILLFELSPPDVTGRLPVAITIDVFVNIRFFYVVFRLIF